MEPSTDFSFEVVEAGKVLASIKILTQGEKVSAIMYARGAQASEPWHTSPQMAVQSASRFVGMVLPLTVPRYADNAEDFTKWLHERKHISTEEYERLLKLVA